MKQTPKKMGRPAFRIDGLRLRAMREEASLTHQELGQRVYDRAGKSAASAEVLKNTVQRWEKSGAIQASMAKHLAEELQTTVAILQGAAPEPAPSRVDEIEAHLRQLIAEGPPPNLLQALQHCDGEKPERELAVRISSHLEAAQLSQAKEEFEFLSSVTGYSIRELKEPTSLEGFWMLVATGHALPHRSEILTGIGDLIAAVRAEMQSCLGDLQGSDAHISFAKEKHWFQVTVYHPRKLQLLRTLRFVRCQPRESGLQWASPTWQDKHWIETLPYHAYGIANFITGFDSVRVPFDCLNLRFAITKIPSLQDRERLGPDFKGETVELCAGNLAKLSPKTLETFRRGGDSHHLIVNWLASDLWEKLQPHMAEWPMECWSFRSEQSRIDIILKVPRKLYANSKAPLLFGNRFSIGLVEITSEGSQRTAPWRQKSVDEIHAQLTKCLWKAQEAESRARPQHSLSR